MQRAKKLKQEEKKVILAYAQLKLKANRLSKELDTMKQNWLTEKTLNYLLEAANIEDAAPEEAPKA